MPGLVLVDLDLSTIWVGEVKTPFVLSLDLVAHCVGPASYTVEVVSHEQYEPAAGGRPCAASMHNGDPCRARNWSSPSATIPNPRKST